MPIKIFITGTDTDVGKTFISSILVKSWNCNYWKPIQTGLDTDAGDTAKVKELTKLTEDYFKQPQIELRKPLSPWRAAVLEGKDLNLCDIQIPKEFAESSKPLIIEGAGGLYVPINKECIMTDLIIKLEAPVILVARSGLGTINHTLLSIEHLKNRGVQILGVILNGPINKDNETALQQFLGKIPIICKISFITDVTKATHLVPNLETLLS